jgi:hypothetical protein
MYSKLKHIYFPNTFSVILHTSMTLILIYCGYNSSVAVLTTLCRLHCITNSMEQSPSWKTSNNSASLEISHLSWNTKVHYYVHESPPSVPLFTHMNLVHPFPSYFSMSHSNIFLLSMHRSSKWSFPFRLFEQNFVCISHLFHMCYMPYSSHSWSDHPNIW